MSDSDPKPHSDFVVDHPRVIPGGGSLSIGPSGLHDLQVISRNWNAHLKSRGE